MERQHRDRPVDTAWVTAPSVRKLKDGFLFFDPAAHKRVRAPRDLLDRFLALADTESGEDRSVLQFARSYGALGVNSNGWHRESRLEKLFLEYQRHAFESRGAKAMAKYSSLLAEGESHREPVSGWRRMAARLGAAIEVGIALNHGEIGDPGHWLVLAARRKSLSESRPWEIVRGSRDWGGTLMALRDEFEMLMRTLILQFGVTLRFSWNAAAGEWKIDLDAGQGLGGWQGMGNLGGILVFQAMMRIADRAFAICCHCHRPYTPGRLPGGGRRNYCGLQECKRAAWRASKARRKAPTGGR